MCDAFNHVWSQVAYFYRLHATGIDVRTIHTEDISKASAMPMIMANLFNITDIPEGMSVQRSCGQHTTSQDPLNSTRAAKEVLRDPRNPSTQAVCMLHIFYYACLPQYLHDKHACFEVFLEHHWRLKCILYGGGGEIYLLFLWFVVVASFLLHIGHTHRNFFRLRVLIKQTPRFWSRRFKSVLETSRCECERIWKSRN